MFWTAGLRSPQRQEIFLISSAQIRFGWHPTPYPMGTEGSVPGVTAARTWSLPVTSIWCYTSTPPYVFREWCLINYKDYFTILAYFPYFGKRRLMRSPLLSVNLRLLTYECLNQSLLNLPISTVYFINPSNQSVSTCVYPSIAARQRLSKNIPLQRIHAQQ
jgi:hypothetical protein